MPVVVSCSSCGRLLQLRDGALGGRVRCPRCGTVFVADAKAGAGGNEERPQRASSESGDGTYGVQSEPSPRPPASRRPGEEPRRRRRRPLRDWGDESGDRPRGKDHRGPLILVLGILSVALSCIPLAGWILGAFSMSMASQDERLMEERLMDRAGYGMTRAGQICGIVGVFAATVVFIVAMCLQVRRAVRF